MSQTRRPAFAQGFPESPELDALVEAFGRGDYAAVRSRAPELERSSSDPGVRAAARMLVDRTKPDPVAVGLLVLAALLLATLGGWWLSHGHPRPPAGAR